MVVTGADLEIFIALSLMLTSLVFIIIPFVPAPLVVWLVAIGYGIMDGFDRLTIFGSVLLTLLMIMGVTVDFWLRPLGMGSHGGCLTSMGSLIGGVLGTFLIPIPILGSILGAVIGAFVVVWIRRRELRDAVDAGGATLKMIMVGKLVELFICLAMFAVFLGSLYFTR
ncbi:MAG: DUF456 domain-containing protein [Chloroflexi bacterium]|nr:DUF456 domain-containing protein [Chloroflexota bacterium]